MQKLKKKRRSKRKPKIGRPNTKEGQSVSLYLSGKAVKMLKRVSRERGLSMSEVADRKLSDREV